MTPEPEPTTEDIKNGNLKAVQDYYGQHPDLIDVRLPNSFWETPLLTAIEAKQTDIALFLLEHGASPHHHSVQYGLMPLMLAAEKGLLSVAEKLIEKGATVDQQIFSNSFPEGETALIKAVFAGHLDMVQFLLKADAQVDKPDIYHQTPLFHALRWYQPKIAEELLSYGASIEGDPENYYPLLLSFISSTDQIIIRPKLLKIVNFLLDHGADIEARERSYGGTALIYAAGQRTSGLVELLLKKGANPNAATKDGFTALMWAVRFSDNEAEIEALLRAGADINATYRNSSVSVFDEARSYNQETALKKVVQELEKERAARVRAATDFSKGLKKPLPIPPSPFAKGPKL